MPAGIRAPEPQTHPGREEKPGLPVPLVNEPDHHPVYSRRLLWGALLGAVIGGVIFGWLGYAVSSGPLPVAGLGQFASAGTAVAVFTGAGVGSALGALIGGLAAFGGMLRH